MAGSLRVLRDMTTKAAFPDESGRKRTKARPSVISNPGKLIPA
jgi:hypothetical protein